MYVHTHVYTLCTYIHMYIHILFACSAALNEHTHTHSLGYTVDDVNNHYYPILDGNLFCFIGGCIHIASCLV